MTVTVIESKNNKTLFFLLECKRTGPGCSKLTASLVNDSLKFQTLISQICQYFLSKKCEKLLQKLFSTKISVYLIHLQKLLTFFQQKISVYLIMKSLNT